LVSANTYLEEQDGLLWLRHLNGTVLYFTRNLLTPQGDYLVEETTAGARWLISHEGRIVHREWPATQPADWTGPASEGFRPVRRNGRYSLFMTKLSHSTTAQPG
jgi:ligand-binding sensor domain-containing protein